MTLLKGNQIAISETDNYMVFISCVFSTSAFYGGSPVCAAFHRVLSTGRRWTKGLG